MQPIPHSGAPPELLMVQYLLVSYLDDCARKASGKMSGKIRIDIAGKLAAVFTTAMIAAFAVTGSAHATDVKFTLDWTFQGPQSPFVLAAERGYFAAEGLNVTID